MINVEALKPADAIWLFKVAWFYGAVTQQYSRMGNWLTSEKLPAFCFLLLYFQEDIPWTFKPFKKVSEVQNDK